MCQINFGKGLKKYRTFYLTSSLILVVVKKEQDTGYVTSYDYDDGMDYRLAPTPGKGPRVVLD